MSPARDPSDRPNEDSVASDNVTFEEATGTYQTEFGRDGRTATEAVVDKMSEMTQTDPLELPPIFDVLDPDSLNTLFNGSPSSQPQTETFVIFEYIGHQVTVKRNGAIRITPILPKHR